jgi:hypothetical protein
MLKPRDLTHRQLGDIVTALQEAFYLDTDEQGNAIWDPDSEVNGGDLVETMGVHLRMHGLCPETVLPAGEPADIVRLLHVWDKGNRRIVVALLSERPQSTVAEFTRQLAARGGDVDTLLALMKNRESLPS